MGAREYSSRIDAIVCNNPIVRQKSIRITVEVSPSLYRQLEEQAAARSSSVRELVLKGVKNIVLQEKRPHCKRVRFPLIISEGPKVKLTNNQIYKQVEFP